MQREPFPLKPKRQEHEKLPGVLLQLVFGSQGSDKHSSISVGGDQKQGLDYCFCKRERNNIMFATK